MFVDLFVFICKFQYLSHIKIVEVEICLVYTYLY